MANLHSYFTIIPKEKKVSSYFIYEPQSKQAWWDKKVQPTDTFVVVANGYSLYIRSDSSSPVTFGDIHISYIDHPISLTIPHLIPLLKSNLQKSFRLQNEPVFLSTALALLKLDFTSLFRRLPILMIEDGYPTHSMSVLIWWMMAANKYVFTEQDRNLLCSILSSMCRSSLVWNDTRNNEVPSYSISQLQSHEHSNVLLSIYIRMEYGGMEGDMKMLTRCIDYCFSRPEYPFTEMIPDIVVPESRVLLLPTAIDFHPYPSMISEISKRTYVKRAEVQSFIWYTQSAINLRKEDTKRKQEEWNKHRQKSILDTCLTEWRNKLLV